MSSTIPHGPVPDSPTGVRPLPPRPNLEFERKQAKHLLRDVRSSDPDAPTRMREILEARDVLGDDRKRRAYDASLGIMRPPPQAPRPPRGLATRPEDV